MLSLILHAAIMAAIRTDTLLQIHDGCISISIAIRVWGDNGIDNPILKKGKKKPCFALCSSRAISSPARGTVSLHRSYLNAGNINSMSSCEVERKEN